MAASSEGLGENATCAAMFVRLATSIKHIADGTFFAALTRGNASFRIRHFSGHCSQAWHRPSLCTKRMTIQLKTPAAGTLAHCSSGMVTLGRI
jgi:hypothetical protein